MCIIVNVSYRQCRFPCNSSFSMLYNSSVICQFSSGKAKVWVPNPVALREGKTYNVRYYHLF